MLHAPRFGPRLREIGTRNQALVERIQSGEADEGDFRQRVLAHLDATVADKMAVSRPPRAVETPVDSRELRT